MVDIGLKERVHDHWNKESCGEVYAGSDGHDLSAQERTRYQLEPYIAGFAHFDEAPGKDVLEVGVGMGADHLQWARARPRSLSGVDLTERAIGHTTGRIREAGFVSDLRVADAESLPFPDNSFDIVYSWGVIHHSPDTQRCLGEIFRVLRPGGVARIMVYNKWSLVGLMLWTRFGLLTGRPWRSMADIYKSHLQGPATKAYTVSEFEAMGRKAGFGDVHGRVQLAHGDLLEGEIGARHPGVILNVAKALWPRPLLRATASGLGLYLLLEARKTA